MVHAKLAAALNPAIVIRQRQAQHRAGGFNQPPCSDRRKPEIAKTVTPQHDEDAHRYFTTVTCKRKRDNSIYPRASLFDVTFSLGVCFLRWPRAHPLTVPKLAGVTQHDTFS